MPEINREDVRELFLGTYRIIYTVKDSFVAVLTVMEGHHLLDPKLVDVD